MNQLNRIFYLIAAMFITMSIHAQETIVVSVEGACSSYTKKNSLEAITKKLAVKECAKETSIYLANEQCESQGQSQDIKSEFIGCDKLEFKEDGTKMIEYKCFYETKLKCLIK